MHNPRHDQHFARNLQQYIVIIVIFVDQYLSDTDLQFCIALVIVIVSSISFCCAIFNEMQSCTFANISDSHSHWSKTCVCNYLDIFYLNIYRALYLHTYIA